MVVAATPAVVSVMSVAHMRPTHPTSAHSGSAAPLSRAKAWVQALIPRLSFAEPMESEFHEWYASRVRWRMRSTLWLAMGNILLVLFALGPFLSFRHALFGREHDRSLTGLAVILLATSALALIVVSSRRFYRRFYDITAQFIAPVQAICFATMDVLMHGQGYSLSAWMPLVIIAPYFLFGMLHYQAARCSILAVIAYIAAGELAGINGAQRWLDVAIVSFASVLGAAIHLSLQRAVRHGYLATQSLNESAHRDSLTGIHNRRMFDEHMTRVWQQAARESLPLGLLLVDLDHFKAFNDTHGHQGGDTCLAKVASLLPQVARRPLDLAARYGGEEFVVLLYDARREQVEEVCIQLHAALKHAAIAHDASTTGQVTFSIGAACVEPRLDRHAEGLIQLADEALYAAKERGRNRTVIMDREYETLKTGAFRVRRVGGRTA
jgi:diguanylate cyclase (GGDEF)-like protein